MRKILENSDLGEIFYGFHYGILGICVHAITLLFIVYAVFYEQTVQTYLS